MLKRALIALLSLVALIAISGFVAVQAWSKPLPEGEPSAEADARVRAMWAAVDAEAWERTGAVSWVFGGRQEHLWDRERHLARVRWKKNEVLVDLTKAQGRAWVGGEEVHGDRAQRLVERAYAAWINDSFWLNPVVKAFDDGTVRILVDVEEGEGVMVQYRSGGLTPGDSYLWVLGPDQVPTAWRMWVSIIPIGGFEASWEGWIELETGAKVSTVHRMGPVTLELSEVRGAETLEALVGADPFAPLME